MSWAAALVEIGLLTSGLSCEPARAFLSDDYNIHRPFDLYMVDLSSYETINQLLITDLAEIRVGFQKCIDPIRVAHRNKGSLWVTLRRVEGSLWMQSYGFWVSVNRDKINGGDSNNTFLYSSKGGLQCDALSRVYLCFIGCSVIAAKTRDFFCERLLNLSDKLLQTAGRTIGNVGVLGDGLYVESA